MRTVYGMNEGWLFSKTCTAAPDRMPLPGDGWETVNLPHTWNAVDGMIGVPFDRGAYWYVKSFTAPSQPRPEGRTFVEVGAAGLVGEIYVNGQFCTRHVGGYSAFRADVTDCLREGENILAILADNRYSDQVYPQRADFTFYGGLYRYVQLISVAESHISLEDLGGPGVYIDTERTNGGAAVTARVRITSPKAGQRLALSILPAEGAEPCSEAYGSAAEETVLRTFIPQAGLWDPEDAWKLYTARLTLIEYNEVIDEISIRFGVRDAEIDAARGFLLNGRDYPLRGVCRHQDRLYLGNAVADEAAYEDAGLIREMGANTVRLAHYQQSQAMYDACDEAGLLVWAEIPYFAQSWDDEAHAAARNEIRELVAQNYNHPSIFCWGLSNEVLIGGNDNEKLLPCHEDLNQAVKELDSRRLTVIAHEYFAGWDHPLHQVSDAEGWNHYFGWYRGQLDDLAEWCDRYHGQYPDRRFAVTEYGCDSVISYHSDHPEKQDYTEEYQVLLHENACETWASRPWIWGTYVWNMFDFGSSFRREGGTRGRNNKGLVTMDRKIKKDAFYVYKAWYSTEPFVHIDGRRYFARPGTHTTVRIHSNLEKVALYADGALIGEKEGAHTFIFENVPIRDSGTVITAKAGEYTDTVILRSVDEMPAEFTFPGFTETKDAINWFESIEEASADLRDVPGHWSVHDSIAEIAKDPAAKKAFLSCLTAILGRALPEQMVLSGDLNVSAVDFFSNGMWKELIGGKLRKLHAALSKIEKEDP